MKSKTRLKKKLFEKIEKVLKDNGQNWKNKEKVFGCAKHTPRC